MTCKAHARLRVNCTVTSVCGRVSLFGVWRDPSSMTSSTVKKLKSLESTTAARRVIQALGVSWHSDHFVCGGCRKQLGGGGFMEQAGRPYCSACYADKFAARCAGCRQPIVDKAVVALDAKWHKDCFTCTHFITVQPTKLCRCEVNHDSVATTYIRHAGEKKGQGALNLRIASFASNSEQQSLKCRNPVTDSTFHVLDNKPLCGKCA
ncbi:Transforming growth factor beta-1-induced transcript 1 protein [Eumeta japonica]|uniref:Transforming growth factor beta-1-induced transcript 1 protein n=1 Tax=Eumeta variegata TaxID=151549 RepID=A0A4C1V735_EUMVA|nr:Transforming growth factor beta-1-induced transcript 1 protein [Eumeta japonica]